MQRGEDFFVSIADERVSVFKDEVGDVYFQCCSVSEIKEKSLGRYVYRTMNRSNIVMTDEIYYALRHNADFREELTGYLYLLIHTKQSCHFVSRVLKINVSIECYEDGKLMISFKD
ncbi:hypothetical protein [Thomasclavelia sp.]|uniref:hypothetical protein n=1 Tax=Thomasclavelia sp. TaxID=3025757 RepID=UPI0025F97FED|nr:hypothetical protein [Thomasclavelia sp.]